MANVNQCDLRCPAREMLNYDFQQKKGLSRATAAVQVGVQGARLALRAASECPSRAEPASTWEPSEVCSARAKEIASKLGPITLDNTTEHQQRVFMDAGIPVEGLDETPLTEEPEA